MIQQQQQQQSYQRSHPITTTTTRPPPHLSHPRDPTIRHSGRCHIRGKIRRIWRPRYLELYDSGLVRYYELPITADVTLPEVSDVDHVNMIPKDTLVIYHARIIDVTTLRDLHVGLPGGSFGFLFRGQRQLTNELMTNPEPNPPREYFCAVSTLEEAQTWVVALQWSAVVCQQQRRINNNSFNSSSCSIDMSNHHHLQQQQQQQKQRQQQQQKIGEEHGVEDSSILTKTQNRVTGTTTTRRRRRRRGSKQRMGRIVVTKIQGYRIIKSSTHQFHWKITYEIAMLLLKQNRVEERRILITTNELQSLLGQLELELENDSNSQLVLNRIQQSLVTLPPYFELGCNPKDLISSFPIIETAFRSLAMEAKIVNTKALKHLFALDNPTGKSVVVQRINWWETLPSQSSSSSLVAAGRPILTFRQIKLIPKHITSDEYVRHWLHDKPSQKQQMLILRLFQHGPWIVIGLLGVILTVFYPVLLLYYQKMISITIRLDLLLLSWIVAAWSGNRYNSESPSRRRHHHQQQQQQQFHHTDKRSKIVKMTTPSSLIISTVDSSEDVSDDDDGDDGEELDSLMSYDDGDEENLETLSSPLPQFPANCGESCWSVPEDNSIFKVRGATYLNDRIKVPSGPSPFKCRGVDLWITDNPQRHIARHPSVMGGRLGDEDTFMVNFLLPFGNFVSYFTVPPMSEFPGTLANVWSKFVKGDQQYRDARLKLLPMVQDGPWIVKAAVGNGTAPALLGKVIPLQYYFREPDEKQKGIYEVDVIITASTIATGILSVVKGHTKSLTIAFAFIIEAAQEEELPETVLCSFQIHALHLENCPTLPECNLDDEMY